MLNDRRLALRVLRRSDHPNPVIDRPGLKKILSWNLLRRTGANVAALAALIDREKPDLVLMQEATAEIAGLKDRLGGDYAWAPLPGRIHGPALWSPTPFIARPAIVELPSGAMFDRVCQILDVGGFGVANVHLSHGQMLNRRQLRRIAENLPDCAAVIGDYNLVGPPLLAGFRDVGPRRPTHAMARVVPLRLDRCLVRGLTCHASTVLPRGPSDHRPIIVHLAPTPAVARGSERTVKGMAALVGRLRRAAGRAGRGRPDPRASGEPPSSRA